MATDLATAIALGQLGQAGQSERTRRSLAERLTAGATTGRPVYSLGAALAQGLTGALGGYMAADADQREQTARNNAIAEALRGQDERQRAQMDAVIGVTQGNPVPEGQMGPARPASTGPAREDALALLSATNPAARAQLDLDRDRAQRAAQERLVAGQRATQLEVARIQAGTRNQPQLPAGFRMRPDGTAERIPGLPEETGFQGTGMDQQAANVLLRVGPQIERGTASPADRQQYALAWAHMTRPSLQMVPVDPNDPTRGTVLAEVPRSAPQGFMPPDFRPASPAAAAAPPAPPPPPAEVDEAAPPPAPPPPPPPPPPAAAPPPPPPAAPPASAPAAPAPPASGMRIVPGTERLPPGPTPPAGFRWNAERTGLEVIPGGPQDFTTRSLTEAEGRANMFGAQMRMGDEIIRSVRVPNSATIMAWRNLPEAPVNMVMSENDQQYFNAVRLFAAGVLRRETGAAFTAQELMDVQSRFFPMPGDVGRTIDQKARARRQIIASVIAEVRGGLRGDTGQDTPAPAPGAVRRWNPTTGALE